MRMAGGMLSPPAGRGRGPPEQAGLHRGQRSSARCTQLSAEEVLGTAASMEGISPLPRPRLRMPAGSMDIGGLVGHSGELTFGHAGVLAGGQGGLP